MCGCTVFDLKCSRLSSFQMMMSVWGSEQVRQMREALHRLKGSSVRGRGMLTRKWPPPRAPALAQALGGERRTMKRPSTTGASHHRQQRSLRGPADDPLTLVVHIFVPVLLPSVLSCTLLAAFRRAYIPWQRDISPR